MVDGVDHGRRVIKLVGVGDCGGRGFWGNAVDGASVVVPGRLPRARLQERAGALLGFVMAPESIAHLGRQQAEDDVLFVINPGPHRAINHSSIWNVTEEELHKPEKVSDYHRVGDCEIYFHNADDRSSSPWRRWRAHSA